MKSANPTIFFYQLIMGSMYAIYGIIYHQYTPFMLAYIPAPWIRHGLWDIVKWMAHSTRIHRNPLANIQRSDIEHGHRNSWFSHQKWWCSIISYVSLPEGKIKGIIVMAPLVWSSLNHDYIIDFFDRGTWVNMYSASGSGLDHGSRIRQTMSSGWNTRMFLGIQVKN
jgi:hypothetical protein